MRGPRPRLLDTLPADEGKTPVRPATAATLILLLVAIIGAAAFQLLQASP